MSTRNIAIVVALLVVLAIGAWALGWFTTDTAITEPAGPGAPATTMSPPPTEEGTTAQDTPGATPPQPGPGATDAPVRTEEPAQTEPATDPTVTETDPTVTDIEPTVTVTDPATDPTVTETDPAVTEEAEEEDDTITLPAQQQ